MSKETTNSFDLIPYQIVAKRLMNPAILLVVLGLAIWLGGRYIGLPYQQWDPIGISMTIAGFLIALYCLRAKQAKVVCHKNRIVIYAPLHPIAISYKRILVIRSSEFRRIFPMDQYKRGFVERYKPLYATTVPIVELRGFPYPDWYMRLWLHKLLFAPNATALVFPVKDWMAFSRSVDSRRAEWHGQRRAREEY